MDIAALKTFLAVAQERSFSRAAAKVHRTQPAVSQAVRRLEVDLGEQLFDRSSKTGTLTDAGKVLQNYGERLVRLAEEAESAMRELRDLRRGRVLIGANEAAVHALLPRRCAVTEIASKRLVAVPVNGVSRKREVTLVCRKAHRSHAADAFLKVAQEKQA